MYNTWCGKLGMGPGMRLVELTIIVYDCNIDCIAKKHISCDSRVTCGCQNQLKNLIFLQCDCIWPQSDPGITAQPHYRGWQKVVRLTWMGGGSKYKVHTLLSLIFMSHKINSALVLIFLAKILVRRYNIMCIMFRTDRFMVAQKVTQDFTLAIQILNHRLGRNPQLIY